MARPIVETDALEQSAAHAGFALACPFSSSAEFEAALIRERRAAGVYGPRRHRKQMLAAGLAASLAVAVLVAVILLA